MDKDEEQKQGHDEGIEENKRIRTGKSTITKGNGTLNNKVEITQYN